MAGSCSEASTRQREPARGNKIVAFAALKRPRSAVAPSDFCRDFDVIGARRVSHLRFKF